MGRRARKTQQLPKSGPMCGFCSTAKVRVCHWLADAVALQLSRVRPIVQTFRT